MGNQRRPRGASLTAETQAAESPIRIAAAVILDAEGRMLVVRKRGTRFFMQPGGKMDEGESPAEALVREVAEELGCQVDQAEFLGQCSAVAVNEPMRIVEADLFLVSVDGEIRPAREIEELAWVGPSENCGQPLAPLTRDCVLPLVRSRWLGRGGVGRNSQ